MENLYEFQGINDQQRSFYFICDLQVKLSTSVSAKKKIAKILSTICEYFKVKISI